MPPLALSGCGYSDFQRLDEQTKSAGREVLNHFQRRADLIPNGRGTVKGRGQLRAETLPPGGGGAPKPPRSGHCRSSVNDPAAFQKFQAAQGEFSSALSRLLVVSELPEPEGQPGLPGPARRSSRAPENASPLARGRYVKGGAGLLADARAQLSDQLHRDAVSATGWGTAVQNEAQISQPPAVSFSFKPASEARARPWCASGASGTRSGRLALAATRCYDADRPSAPGAGAASARR